MFHDTRVFGRNFGVHQLWTELRQEFPGFEFQHSHGLGVLLIGIDVSSAVQAFIGMANEDTLPIQNLFERAAQLWLTDEVLTYQRRFESASITQKVKDSLYCELYIDHGQGFTEGEKLISNIKLENGKGIILYELRNISSGIAGLRFDPGVEAIALESLSARGCDPEGSWHELGIIRNSCIRREQDVLLFPTDPWVEFALPKEEIDTIEIELKVLARGEALIDALFQQNAQLDTILVKHEGKLERLEGDLSVKDDEITAMSNALSEKETLLSVHEAEVEKLWSDLSTKDNEITAMSNALSEKETLLSVHEAEVEKLWSDLSTKDNEITAMSNALSEVGDDIAIMEKTLHCINTSRLYRLLNLLRLIPPTH